jgi:hypothetical protein
MLRVIDLFSRTMIEYLGINRKLLKYKETKNLFLKSFTLNLLISNN